MNIIADLQLHSKYARAVSSQMELPFIHLWGKRKGLQLLATGDWQHPQWFELIKEQLQEVSPGIFQLKEQYELKNELEYKTTTEFLLVSEVSCIYKQDDKVRKVHHLIFSPSIETCQKVIEAFEQRKFNLAYDGRPIIGISSYDLLLMLLEIDSNIMLLPAHVWTPWFGLYGSKSGFNSIEECFKDLSPYIYAIETGFSSDPCMNWQIKDMDTRSIVSFSDAHSAPKMGREATIFTTEVNDWNYLDIIHAIKQTSDSRMQIAFTQEFYPEEGKYHWSGHRAHGIVYSPKDILQKGKICPICHKPLTIGVENRVEELCSRKINTSDLKIIANKDLKEPIKDFANDIHFVCDKGRKRKPYISSIPLVEILQESLHSKAKAEREYMRITNKVNEFNILLKLNQEDLNSLDIPSLTAALAKVRQRNVHITPGYDGVYGKVQISLEEGLF